MRVVIGCTLSWVRLWGGGAALERVFGVGVNLGEVDGEVVLRLEDGEGRDLEAGEES